VLSSATADRKVLFEAINRTRSGGGTSFYDALEETVSQRLSRIAGRKAVVVLSDGVDTTSRATLDAAQRAAESSDALVYTVQYDTIDDASKVQLDPISRGETVTNVITPRGEPLSVAYKHATAFMRLLADKTGGRYYMADNTARLAQVFAHIAAELREQYSIGYYPKNRAGEGKQRKIKVTVDAPGAIIHARAAYIFKPRRVARRERTDAVASLLNN
jgi:Ca-activated chloride channel homolog